MTQNFVQLPEPTARAFRQWPSENGMTASRRAEAISRIKAPRRCTPRDAWPSPFCAFRDVKKGWRTIGLCRVCRPLAGVARAVGAGKD